MLAFSLAGIDDLSSQVPGDIDNPIPSLVERAAQGETLRVIIEVQEPAKQTAVSDRAREQGATILHQFERLPLLVMEVQANALQALLGSPWVVSISEDTADPPALNNSLPVIKADQVHSLGWDGSGVAVAILDTGIDRDHPFFAGRVVEEACYSSPGTNRTSLCPNGGMTQTGAGSASINIAACLNGSTSLCTHGPHVAGIAAGDGTGVTGAPAAGVAPAADIIAIQVFTRFNTDDVCGVGNSPCLRSYVSDQIRGLERVLVLSGSHNIAAANMSLGGGSYTSYCDESQAATKTAIDNLRAANIATVIASGNGSQSNAISTPACISTAIAVGSTNNSDSVSSFGNRGQLLDLFAPGESIRSAVASNAYGYKIGTSMAAPHVAGTWAVLRQANPDLSVSEILTLLQDNGKPITYSSDGTNVTTPRIDLLAAVQAVQAEVDDFHWEPVADQVAGMPFPVTVTARDSSGSIVTDFTGTVHLSGWSGISTPVSILIAPTVTGSFVDGVWTGNVTVNEPAADVFLRADLGSGRTGDSHPFEVTRGDLVVTTFADVIDANDGVLSLREAILYANATPEHQAIILPPGTYVLSILGSGEDQAFSGDLDILPGGGITLTGAGLGQTVIDASGLGDRVFHVLAGAELNVLGLTVTGGQVAGDGGGLFNAGQVQLENAAVTNNTADFGGGIRNFGQLVVLDSTILGNTADHGGGLWSNSIATVIDSSFAFNHAHQDGGAIVQTLTTGLSLTGSTLRDNTAGRYGGGLLNASTASVANSTFSGNSALLSGGGVFNSGTLTLDSSTLFGNRADAAGSNAGTGGGIRSNPAGTITVHHTIVAGNVRGTGSTPDDISGTIQGTSSFNLIGDANSSGGLVDDVNGNIVGDSGSGTIVAASILDTTLADNGGPTFTHALVAGSPAIDAGHPSFDPGDYNPPLTTDQRGQNRIVDGLANEVPRIDIGAYELQQPFPLSQIVVTTFADIINPNDGMISLREAVRAANQSDNDVTILLPAGIYLLSIQGRDEDASSIGDLDIAAGSTVTILGAGSAQTVIDANGLGDRVLDVLAGAMLNLQGLTITRGHMPNNGGGIRNAGTVQLHDVVVTNNSGYNGGGIRNTGQLTISASVISENTASNSGGGISNFGGQLTLTGSAVSDNSADYGAGLWTDAEAHVVDSTFSRNDANINGGAIVQATGGTLVLTRSTLSGNEGNYGGGLLNSGTSLVTNSTFSGNQARTGGGGISSSGTLLVRHSTFFGNRANATGTSSEIGGGIRRGGGAITLHSTILAGNLRGTGNLADDIGGTVDAASSFNLVADANSSGGLTDDVNGNIVGNGSSGTMDAATILHTTLTDNGGPTMTHALVFGSPAIDAGDPGFDPGAFDPPLTTDQRGLARVADGLDDGSARIDIGAYEVQGASDLPWIQVTTLDDVIDPNDGLISLREAVIRANSLEIDVTILLSAGTHTLSIQGTDDDQALTGDLDVLAGGSVTIVGARTAPTVIEATGLGDRVFHVLPGASLQLEGVTITGGTIPASGEQRLGGGILNEGQLALTAVVLQGNAASGPETGYQGGGLANLALAAATVTGSTIAGNQAGMGGGLLNLGTMTLIESEISGNTAVSDGGGICQFGTDAWLSIETSSITDNAGASGGGIAAFSGQLDLVASQLRDNIATDPTSGGGGGVYVGQDASVAISASTIAANEALVGAGVLVFGSLQVTDSTISENTAGLFAGGIASGGTLLVLNSTVSGNSATQGGGGIAIDGGNAQVQHSTLFGNRADSDGSGSGIGGGILVNSGSMTLGHTIVAGNLRGSGEAVADDVASIVDTSSGYNLIGDADSTGGLTQGLGGNIVGVDWTTVLDPNWKDNGGTTLTHALIPGSPAIDAGNPDFDPAAFDPPLLTDQRGFPRVMSSLGTARVDIGAVEFDEQIVVTTFDDVIDPDDGWISLREAIRLANQLSSDVTIHLPPGTYHLTIQGPNEDAALTGDLDILPGGSITIIGAGSGQTIIDANDLADRVFHVLSGADLRIEGVTITGGAAPESGTDLEKSGGAILNSGTLALTHGVFDGNSAYRGGGLANSGGTAVIVHSAITNNTGVTFRPSGGGIYNSDGGMVSVSDSTIADNTAFAGAGILNDSGSTLTAVRISVTGNSATGSSAAIVNSGTLTVAASTISGNTSSGISNDGTLVVSNSTIANNWALAMGQIGGGIRTRSAVTTIINSTISGNSAHGDGGGIYAVGGNLTLVNSTVVGNRANSDGTGSFAAGGIYVSLGSMTLQNTIVAGNRQGAVSSDQPSDIMAYDSELAGTFSLISDAATAGGLIHGQNGNIVGVDWATVLDTGLADNGGPTLTHALIPDSPAIDAGDPSFDPDAFDPPLAYDQRGEGFPRVLKGRVDIGAFEFPTPPVETTTIVASNANPSIYGDAIFFTATFSADVGPPTGTVQFFVNGSVLGAPVALANGIAQSMTISTWNVGTHTVTAEYEPEPGAAFGSSSGQLPGGQMVNPRGLTVTADARSKIYGTADPALTYQITAGALVEGDALSGVLTRVAGENVGTYAIAQGTLTAGDNYDLTFVGANLTIAQAALTVTGITAADKVYDETTVATLDVSGSALVGLIGSDVVMLDTSGVAGEFEDENVGQDKMVFISGLTISGPDADNYALVQPTTKASILPIPTGLIVTSLTPTSTGFRVQFNQALDVSVLNLYDQGGMFGPADMTLIRAGGGEVRGSLVVGPTLREATFVQSEGLLAPGTYTVTLTSSATAFRDMLGNLLDGDADGAPGGDYTTSFTIVAPPDDAVTVSLPSFARGYGQPVNLPAGDLTAGLPLSVSNGQSVGQLEFELRYHPDLLIISAFALASGTVSPDAAYDLDLATPGVAVLTITAPSGLTSTDAAVIVGTFTAHVPHDAPYTGKHVLDIAALGVLDTAEPPAELPSVDDDAIHIAAFLGDANGDGSYNSPDATLTRRIIGQINSGLGAYQLADPRLIVDISGNGSIQSNDTTGIRRAIGLMPVADIPALPEGLTMPTAAGPDPRVYIPQDLVGPPAQTVAVPVMIEVTEPAGVSIGGFDLMIEFDPGRFTVTGAQLGQLFDDTDMGGAMTQPALGQLVFAASSLTGTGHLPFGTTGNLATLTVLIAFDAAPGASAFNLLATLGSARTGVYDTALRELVLYPPPTNADDDDADGILTVDDRKELSDRFFYDLGTEPELLDELQVDSVG